MRQKRGHASRVPFTAPWGTPWEALTCFLVLLPCLTLASEPDKPSQDPITVVDQAGRKLTLTKPATRILSLAPSHTELVFHLGAQERLVGRTIHCDHPPEAAKIFSVGSLFPPDYERLLETRPDLVLMNSGSASIRRTLEGYGYVVIVLQPKTVAAVADSLQILGKALGMERIAQEKIHLFQKRLSSLRAPRNRRRPKVFYEVWARPLSSAGPTSFLGNLIEIAGGDNVVRDPSNPWPKVSEEAMIAADPEVFFTAHPTSRDALLQGRRPAWTITRAVRAQQVYLVPDEDILVRPGPRILDGVQWMRQALGQAAKHHAPTGL